MVDIKKELEKYNLTEYQYEDCLKLISDYEDGISKFGYDEIKMKYNIPLHRDSIRKGSQGIFGSCFVKKYLTYKNNKLNTIEDSDYKSSVEQKTDGTVVCDKLIEVCEGEEISPELLLEKHNMSKDLWEVVAYKNNYWHSQIKGGSRMVMYQSRVSIKPKKQNQISFEDIDYLLENKTFKNAISYPRLNYNEEGEVLEIDITDLHCGLLSWSAETGSDFDLKICARDFLSGIDDIVDRSKYKKFKNIYFCTLGDILHIDNDENKTSKGTVQQADGRVSKIFDFTIDIMQTAIEKLMELNAPIQYMYLSGNHDRNLGYYTAKCIQMANIKNPNVEFDISPNPQKAIHFGKVLVGLSHGDMSNKNKGAWITNDYRKEFGESRFVEEHCGHYHSEGLKMINGVLVRNVIAQCGNSFWEHQQGYRSERGIQCFVWNEDKGLRDIWYYYL